MKKILIASTALVSFAAVSSVQAADPIKISVGGYMNQYVGYAHQDKDGQQSFAEVKVESETELYFRGSTKLDNGLTVGVNIDRYSDRDDSGGDDVFLQVSSDTLGKLRLGQTKGAAYALSHGSTDVAFGNNDGDVADWINKPSTAVTSDQTMTSSEDNDGQKIVYWTPSFGGFTAGLSYGLDVNDAGIESVVDVGGTNTANDTAWDAGIAYDGEFSGVSLGADVTYQRNFDGGNSNSALADDRKSWRAGVSVGVSGFSIGGSYRDTSNEGNVKDVDSSGWEAGVAYQTGPYGVSFTYAQFKEDTAANAATEHQADTWVLGGSYDLGAGVTLVGSLFGAEYDDGTTNAANATTDNEGYGFATGLRVDF